MPYFHPVGGWVTPKQQEVIRLLAEGNSIQEIAQDLQVTVYAVRGMRYRIKQNLGIQNFQGLVDYAIKHGIIPNPRAR